MSQQQQQMFHEDDGMERKASYREPREVAASVAAASSSPPSSSIPRISMKYVIMKHFRADLKTVKENADALKALQRVNLSTFADFNYCHLPSKKSRHDCLVEGVHMYEESNYDPLCDMCPVSGVQKESALELDLMAPSGSDHMETLKSVQDAWMVAFAAIQKKMEANRKRIAEGEKLSAADKQYNDLRRTERDAWLQYSIITFEWIRPKLIEYWSKPAPTHTSDNMRFFIQYMRANAVDGVKRTAQAGASARMSGTPQMFCFTHNEVGHMLPCRGRGGYNTACYICPTKDQPSRVEHDKHVLKSFEIRDEKSFTKMCGDGVSKKTKSNSGGGSESSNMAD